MKILINFHSRNTWNKWHFHHASPCMEDIQNKREGRVFRNFKAFWFISQIFYISTNFGNVSKLFSQVSDPQSMVIILTYGRAVTSIYCNKLLCEKEVALKTKTTKISIFPTFYLWLFHWILHWIVLFWNWLLICYWSSIASFFLYKVLLMLTMCLFKYNLMLL